MAKEITTSKGVVSSGIRSGLDNIREGRDGTYADKAVIRREDWGHTHIGTDTYKMNRENGEWEFHHKKY